MRRRVKEQLKKIGGMEFYDVNFSYIDLEEEREEWICVNKVDSFFESFFATNPLSSCFMISDNRQTKTV